MEKPASQEDVERNEGGTNRLEAFSDGVFAIAITLLVLDLKVPPVASLKDVRPAALAQALWVGWPIYLTFVLSFATILIMWVYHHSLFQLRNLFLYIASAMACIVRSVSPWLSPMLATVFCLLTSLKMGCTIPFNRIYGN
ncbi:MAG TPA: TMEM175 family protein [Ktedonobacteraceae bacterium]|nr:TMEM175 family protein [Ktedonobacteraceae bacterium]